MFDDYGYDSIVGDKYYLINIREFEAPMIFGTEDEIKEHIKTVTNMRDYRIIVGLELEVEKDIVLSAVVPVDKDKLVTAKDGE